MGVPGGEARSISERIRDRILRLRARGLGSQTIANQANAWPVPDRPGGDGGGPAPSGPCSCTTEPPIRLRGFGPRMSLRAGSDTAVGWFDE